MKYNSGYTDNRLCFISECSMPARALSLCNKHYKQIKNYGHIFSNDELHEMASTKASNRKWLSHNWSEEAKIRHSVRTKGITFNTGRTHFKKGIKTWNAGMKSMWSEEHITAIKKAKTKYTDLDRLDNRTQRIAFKRFREKVLARDNFTCLVCSQYGGKLQVDHIENWANNPELRFELTNCRTVCMACHYYITYKKKIPQGLLWGHNKEII